MCTDAEFLGIQRLCTSSACSVVIAALWNKLGQVFVPDKGMDENLLCTSLTTDLPSNRGEGIFLGTFILPMLFNWCRGLRVVFSSKSTCTANRHPCTWKLFHF